MELPNHEGCPVSIMSSSLQDWNDQTLISKPQVTSATRRPFLTICLCFIMNVFYCY